METRKINSRYRWGGHPRFKEFFENNRLGFALRLSLTISIGIFVIIFAVCTALCLIASILFDMHSCWKQANPFVVGFGGLMVWFPIILAHGLTDAYKNRFKETRW